MSKRLVLSAAFLGWALILSLNAQTWTGAKRLTWSTYDSIDPTVATDSNDIIHLVWSDSMLGWSSREMRYRRSTDGGGTWSPAQRLTGNAIHDWFPSMAVDSNDNIHIVWQQGVLMEGDASNEVYCKKSTDGGGTWSPSKRLTWNAGYSKFPRIAVDSNNHLHLVWRDDTPGSYELFYKKSTDGGTTWSAAKILTSMNNTTWLEYEPPDIATDSDNNVYIVWGQSSQIFITKSTDGGNSWSSPARVSDSGVFIPQQGPTLSIDSTDHIHIVWYCNKDSGFNNEIYYNRSTDGGLNWEGSRRLTWTSGQSFSPSVFTDPNNHVHIVWYDDSPGNNEIYYKRSTDAGVSWGGIKRLTWSSADSWSPVGVVDSNLAIHVFWEDTPISEYDLEIYYRKGVQ